MIKSIVFFIQNFSRSAGSERVTSIIANELVKQGYDVSVLSICGDNTCYYSLDNRIKLYTLFNKESVNNRKEFFAVLSNLKKFYNTHKVDLVIDIFAALSIYTVILKKKFGFKNLTWEHFNYKVNTGMNKIGRKMAVRFSDQIVTLTNTDKHYYLDDNKIKGKIDYIYNPSPYQNVISNYDREHLIVSVGRLTSQKGFDRLINVWELVEKKCDWKLMIFGDGDDKDILQEQIDNKHLKNIKLMGAVKNIDEYYNKSSIYVSTARYEGLPMTMIEAQSFGIPIVSFDYDTGPKEIVNDNHNGFIIEQGDEESMIRNCSEKLLLLVNNEELRTSFSHDAYNSSLRFTTDSIISKWINLLEELG